MSNLDRYNHEHDIDARFAIHHHNKILRDQDVLRADGSYIKVNLYLFNADNAKTFSEPQFEVFYNRLTAIWEEPR